MAMDEGELSNALKVAAGVLARGERPDLLTAILTAKALNTGGRRRKKSQ
jgi:hypothetical protein